MKCSVCMGLFCATTFWFSCWWSLKGFCQSRPLSTWKLSFRNLELKLIISRHYELELSDFYSHISRRYWLRLSILFLCAWGSLLRCNSWRIIIVSHVIRNAVCFHYRQLIYNYPEQMFAAAGVMAIEHADFAGVERLALVTGK